MCVRENVRRPLIWVRVVTKKDASSATGFYRACCSEIMHWGLNILERFGDIFAVPHRIMTTFLPTLVKNKMGTSEVSSSTSTAPFGAKYNSVMKAPGPLGAPSSMRGNVTRTIQITSPLFLASRARRGFFCIWDGAALRRGTH